MSTNECPGVEVLRLLLDVKLDPDEMEEVGVHVESCHSCQAVLESLTSYHPFHGEASGWSTAKDVESSGGGTHPDSMAVRPLDPASAPTPGQAETVDRADAHGLDLDVDVETEASRFGPDGVTSEVETLPPDAEQDRRPRVGLPGLVIPGYELLKLLGAGGMGVVYLAVQKRLNRRVAVKMIRAGSQARPEHFSRFRIEAEAVARLRHPNILQIYDIGEVEELPYVSLELLEGGSLEDRLEGTPQPGRPSALIARTLARAVQVAHDAGIIHRDLKPSNVLFTEDAIPKITDFGLAKLMVSDSRHTESGQILGSPSYMAPEQALGHARDVGPAADVYALGAILYEMLTGRPPFKGETPMETVRQVIDEEVVPPSRLVPKVARDLETICLKCLEKAPARRYASANDLADDLERYHNGETIQARRTHLLERSLKWVRRRPAAAALLILGVTAFLSLPSGGFLYLRNKSLRANQSSRRAVELVTLGNRLLDAERQANSPEGWSQSQAELSKFYGALQDDETSLIAGLPAQIKDALGRVDRKLRESRESDDQQKRNLAERQRYEKFRGLRIQAQLYEVHFELSSADRLAKLREAARAALALYARDPGALDGRWSLTAQLPEALTGPEKSNVAEGCYDLLLMLSQAVDASSGLSVLEQARRLRSDPTAAYHLRRAACFTKANDAVARKREEAIAAGLQPVTALDHFLIGRERVANRRWGEAIGALEAALRRDPELTAARLLLAISTFNVQPKRLSESLTHVNDCLKSHPDLVGLYLLRALVHGQQGNEIEFRIDPTRVIEARALRSQAKDAFAAAEADYHSAINLGPTDDFRYVLLVNRGGMYLQAGRFDESLADLGEAIRLRPTLYQAYASLAQLHQRRGRLDDASKSFGLAIARAAAPAVRVALHRTRSALLAGRIEATPEQRLEAIKDLEEAIRLEPDASLRSNDHADRARLLFAEGRHEETLGACDQAIKLDPEQSAAHRLRIYALMALKRFDEVLGSCDAYLDGGEPTVEVLEVRGLARVARQNFPGAIADYTRAVEMRPAPDLATRARLLNHRGWAYHFSDAPRLALGDFEASLNLSKEQSDARAGRGLARVRLGEWRLAVADAEAAVKIAKTEATAAGDSTLGRQASYNAARIYAQATEFAAAEVTREGQRAVVLYRRYHARALDLLRQVLEQVPASERSTLLADPMLTPLRVGPRSDARMQARPNNLPDAR